MEERFAVTAATGALGPVLVKLAALLGDEYKLLEGTRRGIESIKSMLEPVHHLLGKLWGREDLDVSCKDWMAEARELSYDMEDGIDGFSLALERGDDGSFIQRTATDSPFKGFMERVKDVSQRCGEMQKIIGDSTCNSSKPTTDPRALFLHKDASELVGMEKKKAELIQLLQKHDMVCITGPAGMGKTTLADLLYHEIGDQFQCRAFVSVHQSPNVVEILGTILRQVKNGVKCAGSATDVAALRNSINDISISLSDKRYLVIIDDVWQWEDWEIICQGLSKNNMDSKILMTTRVKALAQKCQTEHGAHVYTQCFDYDDAESLSNMILDKSVGKDILRANGKELSRKIVHTSGLMPLAVICLSSAWAESYSHGNYGKPWDTWVSEVLMDRFLSTPSLKPLAQNLCLVFDDLPVQLRTCLLYCSIYPLGYSIQRDCLVRKWIAEGFVSQQEVSEAYFDKLVSRNLLQPVLKYQSFYIVHPIMLAFLVGRAKEEKFVACGQHNNCHGSSSHAKQSRRLSLYTGDNPDEDVSDIRSLAILGPQPQVDGRLNKLKNLRVLEIDSCNGLENRHLVDICRLIWLRYLGLNGCLEITEIPREIQRLQNLETLEARNTCICELPVEIGGLVQLRTLNVSGTKVTEVPKEITGLSRLENLDVSSTRVKELPKELRKLQHLRTLDIRVTQVRELPCREVPNSFLSVVGDFDSSSGRVVKLPLGVVSSSGDEEVISSTGANRREGLSILVLFNHFYKRCEVLPVPMHRVTGRHMSIPRWVKQDLNNVSSLDIRLYKLEDDLEFLKKMPNLQALQVRFEVLPREPVAITGGGFSKLETFYVDCRLPWVITFQRRAMPKLKHLEFKFYTGTARQGYSMGIKNLYSIEKLVFRCSEYYTSDAPSICATIEVVRKEATEHPNEITLWINDMRPEVFGSGGTWISLADKTIIEKQFEEWERGIEKREKKIAERRQYVREQSLRLWKAANARAKRDKNTSRAGIEKEIQERKNILEIRERRSLGAPLPDAQIQLLRRAQCTWW